VRDFVIAFTAAIGSLLTALVGLLRFMHERRPKERSPQPPPVDSTGPVGEPGGPPSDANGGGSGASPHQPPPPQGWSGGTRVPASKLPLPAAPRTGPTWWEQQGFVPANDWQGDARQPIPSRANPPAGQAAAAATPWWRSDELRRPPEGAQERSST
jgi:hypothetical protein